MNHRLLLIVTLPLALLGTEPVWAQVHKCTDAGGRISYSDLPCATAPAAARPAPPRATPAATPATAPAPSTAASPPAATSPSTASSAARAPITASPAPVADRRDAPRPTVTAAPPRPAAGEADDDLAARKAAAAQTADCNASLRQMGAAGAGMKLVEAGNARGSAIARCTGG